LAGAGRAREPGGARGRPGHSRQAGAGHPPPAQPHGMTEGVELVLITGYSGAGKTEAVAAFEDAGYFCVDNLPPRMIGTLGELFRHSGSHVRRAAIVSDARGGAYFDELQATLDDLADGGLDPTVVFLEASEEALLDRFKETRRRHPLA